MIFITAGTTNFPFKRLEEIVVEISQKLTGEEIMFQLRQPTHTKYSRNVNLKKYLKPTIFNSYLRNSDLLIIHAGYGTVMQSLELGKSKPLVLPRMKKFGEHVNDHQVNFAKHMELKGLISIWDSDVEITKIKPEKVDRKTLNIYLDELKKRRLILIDYLEKNTINPSVSNK